MMRQIVAPKQGATWREYWPFPMAVGLAAAATIVLAAMGVISRDDAVAPVHAYQEQVNAVVEPYSLDSQQQNTVVATQLHTLQQRTAGVRAGNSSPGRTYVNSHWRAQEKEDTLPREIAGIPAAATIDDVVRAGELYVPGIGTFQVQEERGTFDLTFYYTPKEEDFDTYAQFMQEVELQGSGILKDGRVIRYDGIIVDDLEGRFPHGKTATETRVVPRQTFAVDPSVIPLGSWLVIEVGGRLYVGRAEDTGGAVTGNHIDIFAGVGEEARTWGYDNVAGTGKVVIVEPSQ